MNQNTKDPTQGMFGPNWKGPCRVLRVTKLGTYKLGYVDGQEVRRSWNVEHPQEVFSVSLFKPVTSKGGSTFSSLLNKM